LLPMIMSSCGGALYGGQSSAFRSALTGDASKIKRYYSSKSRALQTDFSGRTLYHWGAAQGHIEAVRQALDLGVDVDLPLTVDNAFGKVYKRRLTSAGLDGATPLYIAAQRGRRDVVALLMERGADPNIRTSNGSTVLMAAAQSSDPEIAIMLLGNGSDINATNEFGESPLLIAALGRHIFDHSFQLMGVSSQIPDPQDSGDNVDITNVLLEHGADPSIRNAQGKTPLIRAWEYGHFALVQLLLEHGADHTELVPVLNNAISPDIAFLYAVRAPRVTENGEIYEFTAYSTGLSTGIMVMERMDQLGVDRRHYSLIIENEDLLKPGGALYLKIQFLGRRPMVSDLGHLVAIYSLTAKLETEKGHSESAASIEGAIRPYQRIYNLLKTEISDTGQLVSIASRGNPRRYCTIGISPPNRKVGFHFESNSDESVTFSETIADFEKLSECFK